MTADTLTVDAAVRRVASIVSAARRAWQTEHQLHDVIQDALEEAGLTVRREVRLTSADRIDMVVDAYGHSIGVEVKITGSVIAVSRQLQRYAHSPDIVGLVLATTKPRHREVPTSLGGMAVQVAVMTAGAW